MTMALVADIGGTNTRVALAKGRALQADSIQRFRNADFEGLEPILHTYLGAQQPGPLSGVCVAIAGPVSDGRGSLTNLNWTIAPEPLSALAGGAPALVVNDLQAQGFALDHLSDSALQALIPGQVSTAATRLVIGVGTGFNIAPVFRSGDTLIVAPAEAGHQTLPVQDSTELALVRALAADTGFAAVEEALSGRGLGNVYRFVAGQNGQNRPADGKELTRLLADGEDAIAKEAMAMFAQLLGRVAGDLALCFLPKGGIYFCGGMSRIVAPYLDQGGFADAFRAKGRFAEFMQDFPVFLIDDDYAALTGCAECLLQHR
ncbi:hypothetical protein ACMU_11965 [Actibacterium mucosum KCTC 23349]|uniref:Glucokinase n=1 Tax=Actibacterium mucosum KCTC 23349 TaxID=1454373 RepID=A0A037ZG50_9RHOB|nr:ROK family protein [Actibacterium mucosum]KAJ55405.1 hypothetical protein ACMU_11965 [Actibacterium mucosum KCTC 23349]